MDERRHFPRQRSFLGGRIAFNARSSTMSCLVRNLTSEGAKVSFSGTVTLPQELDLLIEQHDLEVRARIIWRTEKEIGLQFCGPSSQHNGAEIVPFRQALRLRECEKENSALKRRVEELTSPG